MAKIVTTTAHDMQQPYKSEFERIKEATDENGDILCINCESDYLKEYEKPIRVSVGFTEPKVYKLQTYFCNNCEYYHIDDNDTKSIREFLK